MKSDNEKLKLQIAKNESDHEKSKQTENELRALRLSYNALQSQNEENAQKSSRYKNKLKYAITIINDLNNMLIQYTRKPILNNIETQTEDQYVLYSIYFIKFIVYLLRQICPKK